MKNHQNQLISKEFSENTSEDNFGKFVPQPIL